MRIQRRQLLIGGGVAALSTACTSRKDALRDAAQASSAATAIDDVLERAITAAKRAGASYAEARVVRGTSETIYAREDHVTYVGYDETFGVGVRVLANGAWGFASTSRFDGASAEDAASRATIAAKANARAGLRPVELAPAPVVRGSWKTALERDTLDVPVEEKAAYLQALWSEARAVPGAQHGRGWIQSSREWKVFASSEGSRVEQSISRLGPGFEVTAVNGSTAEFESVAATVAPRQAGWEYLTGSPLANDARRLAEEAVEKLRAPTVTAGKRDLIVDPTNLWLTIHESIGHPTELDRALGLEMNFAGTSYATPDLLGKLRIGSPLVTVYADRTTPGGLATCAWDDEGVATQRWDLVKDGVFVGYQTTREQAGWIGEKASRGTSYAENHRGYPFQRMPNVSLAPSAQGTTLEDVIAATDDGVYAVGNGSWSIDHQRKNFQFGAQKAYEVKRGKIVGPVRNFAYQANSIAFWNACDLLGGAGTWRLGGAMGDGKGEPMQINPVSHGCPVARFRGVNILATRGEDGEKVRS
ncbi:MAG TPA: TldD/PmbA family protein [Polyangiaceae bacterium]|jgi:TldD protein